MIKVDFSDPDFLAGCRPVGPTDCKHLPRGTWWNTDLYHVFKEMINAAKSRILATATLPDISVLDPQARFYLVECLKEHVADDDHTPALLARSLRCRAYSRMVRDYARSCFDEDTDVLGYEELCELDSTIEVVADLAIQYAASELEGSPHNFSKFDPQCGIGARELSLLVALFALAGALQS